MIHQQLKYIYNLGVKRYELTVPLYLPSIKVKNKNQKKEVAFHGYYPKAYLNHMWFWNRFKKVIIHSTSKKLLHTPELYGSLNLAFSCIACQTPQMIRSKQSIAAFKVMSGTLVGATSHLRNEKLQEFCYKWSFLAASSLDLKGHDKSKTVGLTNLFVFELDKLDYKEFEPLSGLDISFDLGKHMRKNYYI